MKIPSHIEAEMTNAGFNKIFESMLKRYQGVMVQAYEATEREHEIWFGSRKYSSYDSFRKCRERILKKD